MKYELYNKIKSYCEENNCWGERNTAKDWNQMLGTNYGAATFTALVNCGLMCKEKGYKATSYSYSLAPTEEMKRAIAEQKREAEISRAKWDIEHYEENVARYQTRYAEMIKEAEEYLASHLDWEAEKLAEAKALLNL